MEFGKYLKTLREERKLLQRELAAILKMDTALLSKIERGNRKIRRDQISAFAEAYNIDPKVLDKRWLVNEVIEIVKGEDNPKAILNTAEKEITNSK